MFLTFKSVLRAYDNSLNRSQIGNVYYGVAQTLTSNS